MSEDPETLEEVERLRQQHEEAAEKMVATKRKDRGYGMCRRRGCSRPASEPDGECQEHDAGTKMVETKRRKGMID